MLSNLRLCGRLLTVFKLPELDSMIVATSNEALVRKLELSSSIRCLYIRSVSKNCGLSAGTPTDAVDTALVCNKIVGFGPLVFWCALKDDESTLCSASSEDQTVFPGRPCYAVYGRG